MPHIALLISGRATGWDNYLLPTIQRSDYYDIDLFMSINSEYENCEYFRVMKEALRPYLKGIYIKKFSIPSDFNNTYDGPHNVKQLIDGKYQPLNVLSMFWNYKNAYDMAVDYSQAHNVSYDFYMTYRSDIILDKIPLFIDIAPDILYTIDQPCQFKGFGLNNIDIVSPEWCYGISVIMNKYLQTYNFILEQSAINSNYICHYESNVTDNCVDKRLNIKHISNVKYDICPNRRRFDNWEVVKDTRIHNIHNRTTEWQDIKDFRFTEECR